MEIAWSMTYDDGNPDHDLEQAPMCLTGSWDHNLSNSNIYIYIYAHFHPDHKLSHIYAPKSCPKESNTASKLYPSRMNILIDFWWLYVCVRFALFCFANNIAIKTRMAKTLFDQVSTCRIVLLFRVYGYAKGRRDDNNLFCTWFNNSSIWNCRISFLLILKIVQGEILVFPLSFFAINH